MKNKNKVLSEMLDKYNANREEHQRVHLWTLGLMTAGLIGKTINTRRPVDSPRMKANIANSHMKTLEGTVVLNK
jgi:hypothetical protein